MIQRRDVSPREWHTAEPHCASTDGRRKQQSNREQFLAPACKGSLTRTREKWQPTILEVDHEETGISRTEKEQRLPSAQYHFLLSDVTTSPSVGDTDTVEVRGLSDFR